MKRNNKQYEIVSIKALGPEDGEPEGTFEAVVAVFGNVDKVGDRLSSKAFDNTLAEWRRKADANGARIPVIFSHDWQNPMSYVGSADPYDVEAKSDGLHVKAVIEHMDTNPVAEQVYKLMKSRVLTQFSFGYTVPKGGETRAKDGAYDLNEVGLFEFGPCLKGINPETDLLAMKSALTDEALPERQRDADTKAVQLRKSYVDVDMPGSYEETTEAVCDAIRATLPADTADTYTYVSIIATYPDRVVYQVCTYGPEGSEDETYQVTYEGSEDAGITLGTPEAVDFVAQAESAEKADTEIQTPETEAPETKAWDGAASNYTDEEWAAACILDRGADAGTAKERYGLPIATPGNSYTDPDADGVHAAADRIGQVDAPEEAKHEAYTRLKAAYTHLGEEAPDSVVEGAKADVIEVPATEEQLRKANLDIAMLTIEQHEHESGKGLTPEAREVLQLDRQLAAEIEALGLGSGA